MNIKQYSPKSFIHLCLAAAALVAVGCDEDDFSEDYDIEFPVAEIAHVSRLSPEAGDTIVIFGNGLTSTTSFFIGTKALPFAEPKVFDCQHAVVVIPRVVEAGEINTTNKYGRKFESGIYVSPVFAVAKVTGWPDELVPGEKFTITGENLDMLKSVKVAGQVVSSTSIEETKATFSLKGVTFDAAVVTITVTPKSGETQAQEVAVSGSGSVY